jgi:hypothetical protein
VAPRDQVESWIGAARRVRAGIAQPGDAGLAAAGRRLEEGNARPGDEELVFAARDGKPGWVAEACAQEEAEAGGAAEDVAARRRGV